MASDAKILALHAKGLDPVAISCRLMTSLTKVRRVLEAAEEITPDPLPSAALPVVSSPKEIGPAAAMAPKAAALLQVIRDAAEAGVETPSLSALSVLVDRQGAHIDATNVSVWINLLEAEGLVIRGGTRNQRTYAIPGTDWTTVAPPRRYGGPAERATRPSPSFEERLAMYAGQRYEDGPEKPGPLVRWSVPSIRGHRWAAPIVEC